jgi:CheY-like chemotaxis protein
MMNGKIWINSEPGKGSVFSFIIQVKRGEEKWQSLLHPEANWKNARILAIDDQGEGRDFFRNAGEQFMIKTDVLSSGEEALSFIKQNGTYDFCFIAGKTPVTGRIELAQRIKKEQGAKHIILIASSMERAAVELEEKTTGLVKVLLKPLFLPVIADCLNECKGGEKSSKEETKKNCFEGYHILLAEDMEINREIVLAMLESTMVKIDCAENGAKAVKLFSENDRRYDIIFMDLQMPEVDGLEATRRIRALNSPQAKKVPIIAMTANVFREDIENCLKAGMNDHLGKPLDLGEVIEKLRYYLPEKPKVLIDNGQ